jgi:hypothetical protein
MAITAVVVPVSQPSNAAFIIWACFALAAVAVAFSRGLRAHVDVSGRALRVHGLRVRSVPIDNVRAVEDAERYRRASTTLIRLTNGRDVRTKAATASQIRQLLSDDPSTR